MNLGSRVSRRMVSVRACTCRRHVLSIRGATTAPAPRRGCPRRGRPGGGLVLLRWPVRPTQGVLVGAGKTREARAFRHLLDKCGLADLARTRHLDETPRLGQAASERCGLRTDIAHAAVYDLLNALSKTTPASVGHTGLKCATPPASPRESSPRSTGRRP